MLITLKVSIMAEVTGYGRHIFGQLILSREF